MVCTSQPRNTKSSHIQKLLSWIARQYAITKLENMHVICLVFRKAEPRYTYNFYAYTKLFIIQDSLKFALPLSSRHVISSEMIWVFTNAYIGECLFILTRYSLDLIIFCVQYQFWLVTYILLIAVMECLWRILSET